MAPKLALLCMAACFLAAVPYALSCEACSSSSSSSEEHGHHHPHHIDHLESCVQRCVAIATPTMISGGTYEHQAKIDKCVADGMEALEAGTPPPAVAAQIRDCINSKHFPDSLKPTVAAFIACEIAALT